MAKLEGLVVKKTELQDLEFLKYLPNLKGLNLIDVTNLQNVSGLEYCPQLEELAMINTRFPDFDTIGSLSCLRHFEYIFEPEYMENGRDDFSFLEKNQNLETICLAGNKVTDVSIFLQYPKLSYLMLDYNPIKTIAPLKELKDLRELEVNNCGLSVLEDFEQFPALQVVSATNNPIPKEQADKLMADYPEIDFFFGDMGL